MYVNKQQRWRDSSVSLCVPFIRRYLHFLDKNFLILFLFFVIRTSVLLIYIYVCIYIYIYIFFKEVIWGLERFLVNNLSLLGIRHIW